MFSIPNQNAFFIHAKLENDPAYKLSVETNDVFNMQLVLRAHKEDFSKEAAVTQIEIAKS